MKKPNKNTLKKELHSFLQQQVVEPHKNWDQQNRSFHRHLHRHSF